MPYVSFATRLRNWRLSQGLSVIEVAERLEVTRDHYYRIERSDQRPSRRFLRLLHRRLGRLRIPDPIEEILIEERKACIRILQEYAEEKEDNYRFAAANIIRRAIQRIQKGRKNVWITGPEGGDGKAPQKTCSTSSLL